MVIELTAASDFNKFINVNFHNHMAKRLQSRRNECPTALRLRRPSDLQAGRRKASWRNQQSALSLPGFKGITIGRCYRGLFTHGLSPESFHDALRHDGLFTGGFRNRLILHAANEVTGASREAALLQSALPARRRKRDHTVALLFTPLPHVGDVIQRTVSDGLTNSR